LALRKRPRFPGLGEQTGSKRTLTNVRGVSDSRGRRKHGDGKKTIYSGDSEGGRGGGGLVQNGADPSHLRGL